MSNVVLSLSDVEKHYNAGKPNEITVLRGVNLNVERGEVVALVAPSGAGKSTLLHIAGLLDTANGGAVSVMGQDMTAKSEVSHTALAIVRGNYRAVSSSGLHFAARLQTSLP